MSIDAKVFVELSKDRHMEAAVKVTENLNKWVRAEFDLFLEGLPEKHNRMSYTINCRHKGNNPEFTNGVSVRTSNHFDHFQIIFTVFDEQHTLHMFTDCSCDYRDYVDGDALSFIIGYWGCHEKIMSIVIDSLKPFGKVWFDHNDCNDEGYIEQ